MVCGPEEYLWGSGIPEIDEKKWDYVVLQERSYSSVTEIKSMKKSLNKLIPYVRAAGAQPVLLMTWAPKEGHMEYKQGHYKGMSRRQCQKKDCQDV